MMIDHISSTANFQHSENSFHGLEKREIVLLALFFCTILLSRLLFMSNSLSDWDSINYALGLHDFDISEHQPHPPGFPVFIFFAKVIYYFLKDDLQALTLISVVFCSLSVFPLFYLFKRLFNSHIAWGGIILFFFIPLIWVNSEMPMSDMTGFFWITLALVLLLKSVEKDIYLVIGSFIFAIAIGIRHTNMFVGCLPLIYLLLVMLKKRRYSSVIWASVGFLGGILIWLIPAAYYTGGAKLYIHAIKSFYADSSLFRYSILNKIFFYEFGKALEDCFIQVWGGYWKAFCAYTFSIIGLVCLARKREKRSKALFLFLAYFPFFLFYLGSLFYLETSRYIILYLPLMVSLAIYGFYLSVREIFTEKRIYLFYLGIIFITVSSIFTLKSTLTNIHKNLDIKEQAINYIVNNYDLGSTIISSDRGYLRYFEYLIHNNGYLLPLSSPKGCDEIIKRKRGLDTITDTYPNTRIIYANGWENIEPVTDMHVPIRWMESESVCYIKKPDKGQFLFIHGGVSDEILRFRPKIRILIDDALIEEVGLHSNNFFICQSTLKITSSNAAWFELRIHVRPTVKRNKIGKFPFSYIIRIGFSPVPYIFPLKWNGLPLSKYLMNEHNIDKRLVYVSAKASPLIGPTWKTVREFDIKEERFRSILGEVDKIERPLHAKILEIKKEHAPIVPYDGFSMFVDLRVNIESLLIRDRGRFFIRTPAITDKDIFIKVEGYTHSLDAPVDRTIEFYFRGKRIASFYPGRQPLPFFRFIRIPEALLNPKEDWSTFEIKVTPQVMRGEGTDTSIYGGLFLNQIASFRHFDDSGVFFCNGLLKDSRGRYVDSAKGGEVFIHKGPFNFIKLSMASDPDHFQTDTTVSLSLNNKPMDVIRFTSTPNCQRYYLIPESQDPVIFGVAIENSDYRHSSVLIERSNPVDRLIYSSGWFDPEEDRIRRMRWRWMGREAVVYVRNPMKDAVLEIKGLAELHLFNSPLAVKIYVNGVEKDAFELKYNLMTRARFYLTKNMFAKKYMLLKEELGSSQWIELKLRVNQTIVPDDFYKNNDKRELGLRTTTICLYPTD